MKKITSRIVSLSLMCSLLVSLNVPVSATATDVFVSNGFNDAYHGGFNLSSYGFTNTSYR